MQALHLRWNGKAAETSQKTSEFLEIKTKVRQLASSFPVQVNNGRKGCRNVIGNFGLSVH